MKKKILTVVGARPNFIKITQFEKVFNKYPEEFEFRLLHTGQHFDDNMSKVFFRQLKVKEPDYYLNIHGGSPAQQVGRIIVAMDEILQEFQPDLVVVVGDVNSTLAASIAANKLRIKVAHVESGLRSFDKGMPEEHNRILTDAITDILLVTEESGRKHLLEEGKPPSKIHFVGNTMIDTLVAFDAEIQASTILEDLGVAPQSYVLITMHRPATVDHKEGLLKLLAILKMVAAKYKVVFPVHPRTAKRLKAHDLYEEMEAIPNIALSGPMDYLAFQKLIANAKFLLTDSGGIQEETTFRQIPCLTLRPNTERPSTVDLGTNELITFDLDLIAEKVASIEAGTFKPNHQIPPFWDGKATERIVEVFRHHI